jgi:outer membrane protein assembly factor BamA
LHLDLTERVRQAYYAKGYADVQVRLQPEAGEATPEGRRSVVIAVQIEPGPLVRIGEVRFEGNNHTVLSILRKRVSVKSGDPLNPVLLEGSRYRLSRLGIFDEVNLHYDPSDGEVRNPIFALREGPAYEMNLLAGYGSYEQLRGGVEFRQMNLFGHAHQSRLELVESMKSTRGEYTYAVPGLFGELVDGSARAYGLEREEIAFIRQEYGGNMTLKRKIPWINADGSVGYSFESLNNSDSELMTSETDSTKVTVASIDLGLNCDRRDSMLRPRRGYRWFFQVELANDALGGESNYERFELGCSAHFALGKWQYAHISFTHGVITDYGNKNEVVPVNKLFFPGGDNSIRGYQEGEAAPKGPDGLFIGAKTYALLNLECEQVLTKSWSAVVFLDTLGTAVELADYPFDEVLYSVGAGIRYQTLVGPVRLEYGYNLNPRPGDPSGTWLLSVGFPF